MNVETLHKPETHHPVTQRMGIISIYATAREGSGTWSVPASDLIDWLARFNTYWMQRGGIAAGENLHWLYDRAVSVRGYALQNQPEELKALACGLAAMNVGLNWMMTLEDVADCPAPCGAFIADLGVAGVSVFLSKDSEVTPELVDRLSEILASGVGLTLLGWVEKLKAAKAFQREIFNTSSVTLINRRIDSGETEHRRVPRQTCQGRIQMVVGGQGHIYPCLGLAGVEACRIGHVSDPVDKLFRKRPDEVVDISRMISHGPDVPEIMEAEVEDGTTLECHFHQKMILQALGRG